MKHDTDANRDAKLMRVRMKYGMEGYGLYWYLVELIGAGIDENNLTCELEHDAELISHDTGIHQERVEEMIMFMARLELFENSQGVITCFKILKRLDQSMTSSKKLREAIEKIRSGHDPVMIESCSSHDEVMKEKNRIEKNRYRRFTPPDVSDVEGRIAEMGYRYVTADEFCTFYASKGWKVGKSPMVDWKQALAGWEAREKKKKNVEVEHYH